MLTHRPDPRVPGIPGARGSDSDFPQRYVIGFGQVMERAVEHVQLGIRLTLQPGRQLLADGKRVPLQRRALEILSALAEAKGEVVTKDELMAAVWPRAIVEENALQVQIVALRKAMRGDANCLKTVHGIGYQLELPASLEDGPTPTGASSSDRQGAAPAPDTSPPLAAPREEDELGDVPAVAVLPFTNRTGLREDDPFAAGLAEDLIEALAQGVNVRVLSRAATARFRSDANPDFDALARKLGLRYLLEGSVRRNGEVMLFTGQLVEARTGAVLSNQKFERPLAEVPESQEELAETIACHLDTQVYNFEMARSLRKSTTRLNAWEAIQRSLAAFSNASPASMEAAVEEARRAIAIAPSYGLAYAVFANALACRYSFGPNWQDDPHVVREVKSLIAKALSLSPNDSLTVTFAGLASCNIVDWKAALHHGQKALQLSKGAFAAHYVRAHGFCQANRWKECIEENKAELRVSPGNQVEYIVYNTIGFAQLGQKQWAEAEQWLAKSRAHNPDNNYSLLLLALTLAAQGRKDEALNHMRQYRSAESGRTRASAENYLRTYLHEAPVMADLLGWLGELWEPVEGAD